MHYGRPLICLLTTLLMFVGVGCQPTKPALPSAPEPTPLATDALIRVHWAGKRQLGVTAGAFTLMRLWELPESVKLENQTLSKLAVAPWQMRQVPLDTDGAQKLRALLKDVLQEPGCIEARGKSNQIDECVLALRLKPPQAWNWRTNLASILGGLTGGQPVIRNNGWQFRGHHGTNTELVTDDDWTLVGFTRNATNTLLGEIAERIQRTGAPLVPRQTSAWIEADCNTAALLQLLTHTSPPTNAPHLSFTVSGDGANVLTEGEFRFPHPLNLPLPAWLIATQQMSEPLVSFSAVRGLDGLFGNTGIWQSLGIESRPDQFFLWSPEGSPLQVRFAAPSPDALKDVQTLSTIAADRGNAWLNANSIGQFAGLADGKGFGWAGLPMVAPYLQAVENGLIVGGLVPGAEAGTNTHTVIFRRPTLQELQARLTSDSNLVAFDWELTGTRIESCLYLGQVLRVAMRHGQLPMDSPSVEWLNAIRPRLGNSTTTVSSPAPDRLAFTRNSGLGLTGAELQLLADWLESAEFPLGLRSSQAP